MNTHNSRDKEMKRRELIKGPSSTDLLVCFPTIPLNTQNHRHMHHHNHGGGGALWCRKSQMASELSEPTSPKVTCVGQIKARPKSLPCKNWQSVMGEIERIHNNNKKHRKKPTWGGALGFKKETMQFLTCLRSFKFDLGCFCAFPNDDDDDDHGDHDHGHEEGPSRSAFSKFFMVLEKNDQDFGLLEKEEVDKLKDDDDVEAQLAPCMPPSNALLLMRCRSAPVKSWLEEKEEKEDDDDDDDDEMKREEVMKFEGDFYKLSCDVAKETWVVGGINKDPISRTQSSKRCSTECLQEVKACLR